MAKKHSQYKPQIRKHPGFAEVQPTSMDNEVNIEETYHKLEGIFELAKIRSSDPSEALPGIIAADALMRSMLDSGLHDHYNSQDFTLSLTVQIREAVQRFIAETGQDPSSDHSIVDHQGRNTLVANGLKDSMIQLGDGGRLDKLSYAHDAYKNLVLLYCGSRQMHQRRMAGQSGSFDDPETANAYEQKFGPYWDKVIENPNTARRETTKSLEFIMSDEVSELLSAVGYTPAHEIVASSLDDPTETIQPNQLLDFTVLPPSAGIQDLATLITSGLSEHDRARVELERLDVLESIRQHVGEEKCFYARSKESGREYADEGGVLIDESYIVLVMQQHSPEGLVVAEHSLAISPVGGKHAAYLTRQDVSDGLSWREVLSLGKKDARDLNARSLKFSTGSSQDKFTMMTEKVKALLNCPPSQFGDQLRMRGDGTYRLSQPKRDLGMSALYLHELGNQKQ